MGVNEVVVEALEGGFQLDPEAFKLLESLDGRLDLVQLIRQVVVTKKDMNLSKSAIITRDDLEAALPPNYEATEVVEKHDIASIEIEPEIEVLRDPTTVINPIEGIRGFQELFRSRFEKLLGIAKQRPDSHHFRNIGDIERRDGKHKTAGLVLDKRVRKGRVEIIIDDNTGRLNVTILNDNLKKNATDLLLDQLAIVDIEFSKQGDAIGKSVYSPDIPNRVLSLSKKRVYALLLSDLHVGSKTFLLEAFNRLIMWLSCKVDETVDEDIIHRVKYVLIAGDVVDGVGVYPGQEHDLEEPNIERQFIKLSNLLEKIPKHLRIFIIPGNHDPTRQALPQPAIPKKYAEPLYALENLRILGNPTTLNLHGVNVLVYHGRSIDDVIASTPGLTVARPALAMKMLLKARHLAPIYGARTSIAPEPEDYLVIEDVPDIFHSGHIHVLDSERYKGSLIINSGAWQAQTKYQSNMGVEPTPGITPIIDLSSLNVMVRDFTKPFVTVEN